MLLHLIDANSITQHILLEHTSQRVDLIVFFLFISSSSLSKEIVNSDVIGIVVNDYARYVLYRIKLLASCRLLRKSTATFKLIFNKITVSFRLMPDLIPDSLWLGRTYHVLQFDCCHRLLARFKIGIRNLNHTLLVVDLLGKSQVRYR